MVIKNDGLAEAIRKSRGQTAEPPKQVYQSLGTHKEIWLLGEQD